MAWTKIGGPAKTLAVFETTLCGLSPEGTSVYRYDGHPEHWTKIGGPQRLLLAEVQIFTRFLRRAPISGNIRGRGISGIRSVVPVTCSWVSVRLFMD